MNIHAATSADLPSKRDRYFLMTQRLNGTHSE